MYSFLNLAAFLWCGGGGGGCSWLGNVGGAYGVRSALLNVGWICQLVGSLSMYAEAPFFETISKGPIRLFASFFFGRGRFRLVVSSQTLSPTWYSIAGCFFLLYWAFIWSAAFSSDRLASACIFCIWETNVVEAGGSEWCLGFGTWEDIGVIAIIDLEGAFSCGGMGTIVVSKSGKGEPLYSIILEMVDEDSKVFFNLLIDSFCLSICLWVPGRDLHDCIPGYIQVPAGICASTCIILMQFSLSKLHYACN